MLHLYGTTRTERLLDRLADRWLGRRVLHALNRAGITSAGDTLGRDMENPDRRPSPRIEHVRAAISEWRHKQRRIREA